MPPLASIVTCVRDQERALFLECAGSVARLDSDFEWIVVDDGSSSESHHFYARVLDEFEHTTRLLRLDQSCGLSQARNEALTVAQGDWVIVLDSDDRLDQRILDYLRDLGAFGGVVSTDALYFDSTKTEYWSAGRYIEMFRQYGGSSLDPFLWFDFYYHGLIARKEVVRRIGGYDNALTVGEDQDILLRATSAVANEEVVYFNRPLYQYRNNPNGVCATQWQEVHANYTATMLRGSKARGGDFCECRLGGTASVQGRKVDCYSYKSLDGRWWQWSDWRDAHYMMGRLKIDECSHQPG